MVRVRRWPVMAVVVATLAVLLSACGVGVDGAPNVIAKKDVPYGLLDPSVTTTTAGPPSQYVTVYFQGPQRLVAVSRAVPPPVSAREAVQALAGGTTTAEAAEGLQSPVSAATPLALSHLATPTVTVTVGSTFAALSGRDQTIAAAQLVFTVTAFPSVQQVTIRMNGKTVAVPTANGTVTHGALNRQDFAALAPI